MNASSGPLSSAPAPRRPRLAVWLWLALLLACALVASRSRFTADLSAFLPRAPSTEQQVLVDQLRDGLVSRLILVGIEGGDSAGRATLSRALGASLRADQRFSAISNGEPVNREADQRLLYGHRYLLSPAVTPEHFSQEGLRAAVADSLDLLASPAGLFTKSLLPRDPTGEMATLLGQFDAGRSVPMRDGAWASRDGRRAVLLAQTAAAGADTDAQEQAIAAIRTAFAQVASRQELPASAAPYRLLMTGPGVFSVQTRDTIRHDVERLSTTALAIIAGMLLLVYRSPRTLALGMVPVLTGALAGVAAVSLGFGGTVHGLTLGFGTTLIGEAVDYSIYLFVQSAHADSRDPREWVRRFWPTIRLGVLTSICGFACLLLSGFPGLAQLGVYSIAGLAAAALTTRHVLPQLLPAGFRLRDVSALGGRLARAAAAAGRLRWCVVVLPLVALAMLWQHPGTLWNPELSSLSPVPKDAQALDSSLRADLGAPDVRYLIVLDGPDRESVLQGAERVGRELDGLVAQGVLTGYETPARYLPSEATQRARQASLPPRAELAQRLAAAVAGQPVKASLFTPFLDDVERARQAPLLQEDDLRGSSLALAVSALLRHQGGRWSATLPLRASGTPEAAPVRAALARAGVAGALFVDLKGESDRLYDNYLREAIHLGLAGFAAIVLLLAAALRSPARVLRTLIPLVAAALVVAAALTFNGRQLSLLHLVGMLLLVAIGSNYALFFNQRADGTATGPSPHTLVSLVLANLATVAAFGLLAASSLPLLQAFGLTVAPGAVLALLFSAMLAAPRRRGARTTGGRS
ncbi:hypothetical protein BKK79_33635 [Cupriavidus sp. USMAA2-4]|uniref:MMPL family transporter n=1 Tax=Cupriavidus sp. USMAA2-4 TaxID=876364 RepID=UPI0008A66E0A|nr:MMPL family transporter [Cupriavidus sp. USMAA2-4]AOY96495.1 hypothetical protein BKK79_33635 [Cupriavidus sp. USMAA2-4]